MVRSTARALGSAATAARRLIGRGQATAESAVPVAPVSTAPDRKAPASTVTVKKTKAKKTTAKKTSAERAAVSPTAATTSPVTKAPATKTPARKSPAKKSPANKSATPPTTTSSKATTTVTTAKKTSTSAPAAKKAPAKKTASKTISTADLLAGLVVKDGEEAWTKAELQEVIDELHEGRDHSLALLEEAEAGLDGLMRDSGDGAGQDQADMGATTFERDHELTVVNSERDKLAQIDRALARIDDGTYGVCESCGEPIGKGRVMAFPRATLCMTCKQREERR